MPGQVLAVPRRSCHRRAQVCAVLPISVGEKVEDQGNDKDNDRSVAQKSTRNGSLRAGWCREPARTGECQRIGRAELNERGGNPEVVRSLGEERLGSIG